MTLDELELREGLRDRARPPAPANPHRMREIGTRITRRRRRRTAGALLGGAAATAMVVVAAGAVPLGGASDATERAAPPVLARPSPPVPSPVAPVLPGRLGDPDGEETAVRRVEGRSGTWPEEGGVSLTVPYRGRELSVVVACTGGSAAELMAWTGIKGQVNAETGRPAEGGMNCTNWPMPQRMRVPPQQVMTVPEGVKKVTIRVRLVRQDWRQLGRVLPGAGRPTGWSVAVYERE